MSLVIHQEHVLWFQSDHICSSEVTLRISATQRDQLMALSVLIKLAYRFKTIDPWRLLNVGILLGSLDREEGCLEIG